MFLMYFIMRNCRSVTKDWFDTASMKWKRRAMMLNVSCILIACYFFYRHNKYCEPFGKMITILLLLQNSVILIILESLNNFSILTVCFERIWSRAFKHGIPSNCSTGFCHDACYDIRKRNQNHLKYITGDHYHVYSVLYISFLPKVVIFLLLSNIEKSNSLNNLYRNIDHSL